MRGEVCYVDQEMPGRGGGRGTREMELERFFERLEYDPSD